MSLIQRKRRWCRSALRSTLATLQSESIALAPSTIPLVISPFCLAVLHPVLWLEKLFPDFLFAFYVDHYEAEGRSGGWSKVRAM